ncbi:hypothetical protein [Streptomyces sp. NPDC001070]
MTYTEGSVEGLQSALIDLSGISLDEFDEVRGLSRALAVLQGQLAHTAAPLCEGSMAAMCGGAR